MIRVYETFVRQLADLQEGQEVSLVVRDLSPGPRKYLARHVRAIVRQVSEQDPSYDRLVVRSMVGNRFPGQWGIRVVAELPQRIPGQPYEDVFKALREIAIGRAGSSD